MGGSSGAYAKRGRRAKAEAALRDMSRAGLVAADGTPGSCEKNPDELMMLMYPGEEATKTGK